MKVCFLMRSEFESVHGGDVVQVNNYCHFLEKLGVSCTLSGRFPDEYFDAYFIVNIDRPIEVYNYCNKIKRSKRPYYIIPIHHPVDAVSKFEIHIRRGLGNFIARLFPDFYRREKFKNIIRCFNRSWYFPLIIKTMLSNFKNIIKDALESSVCVFCIAEKEFDVISERFGARFKHQIIRNGIDKSLLDMNEGFSERDIDIIVVGRIEERKNQMSVIEALGETNIKVCFAGAINDKPTSYQREFIKQCKERENFEFLGKLTQKELFSYYQRSKLLLNVSFFEVSPLVDIEGAIMGCRVLSTIYGYTDENISDVKLVNPYSHSSILENCKEQLTMFPKAHSMNLKQLDWEFSTSVIANELRDLGFD